MIDISFNHFIYNLLIRLYDAQIKNFDRRIDRRVELQKDFENRSDLAESKKIKSMWKNLSKGHLFQKRKLETEKRLFIGLFIVVSIIAMVAYNLLSAPSVIDVIVAIGRLLFQLMWLTGLDYFDPNVSTAVVAKI